MVCCFIGTLYSHTAQSQCDDFSKAILQIIKQESYSDFKHYFEPKEAKRKRMQWPEDTAATNYLNALEAALYESLVSSAKSFREERKKHGWDLSKATYVGCQRTPGLVSAIKVNFKIHNRDESFIIQTFESDQIYITKELIDGKKGFVTPVKSFTVIDNTKYTTFKPRKDEKAKALSYLEKFLAEQSITDYKHYCTLGLMSMRGETFLEFMVMHGESTLYTLVNLDSGECKEVFK